MKPRYVICPGMISSKYDGDRHYIDEHRLMRLYDVNPAECVVRGSLEHIAMGRAADGLPHLYPNYDGNYALLKEIK